MSRLIRKVRTQTGKVFKKWEGENRGEFHTVTGGEGKGGNVSEAAFNAAHNWLDDRNVSVPTPDGSINVTIEDARAAGSAANYDSPNNNYEADDPVYLESVGEVYTAEEIAEAYENMKGITDDIVKYLGGGK